MSSSLEGLHSDFSIKPRSPHGRACKRSLDCISGETVVHRIDVSDDRRTAESLLAIEAPEIPDLVVKLAKAKRLSIVMGNLNRLMQHPTDQELGRRAVRHLGFIDD